jgi:erythromycin esterase-like protein
VSGLIDPFKTFNPNCVTEVEEPYKYDQWHLSGVFSGILRQKIYKSELKDSVYYLYPWHGFNFDYLAYRRLILPPKGKQMKICLTYEFASSNSELLFEVVFFKQNSILKEKQYQLPVTYSKEPENTKVFVKEFEIKIPKQADNVGLKLRNVISEDIDADNRELDVAIGCVGLGRCDIWVNNKRLETYVYNQDSPFIKDEIQQIAEKATDSLFLEEHNRIVGIGESMHGCGDFLKQEYILIKDLINKGFTNFGFELPSLIIYTINEYITGKRNDIEDIIANSNIVFKDSTYVDMFDFMKTYNKSHDNNLAVFGFDIDLLGADSTLHQLERFFPENEKYKKCLDLIKFNPDFLRDSQMVDSLKKIIQEIPENTGNDISLQEQYLQSFLLNKLVFRRPVDNYILLQKRDSLMAENISFYFDRMPAGSKMGVVAHLDHLSKKENGCENHSNYYSSAGYYISNKYGEKYKVIGLYVGSGSFFSKQYTGFGNTPIKGSCPVYRPIGKSFEQLGLDINKPAFYLSDINSIPLLDRILYTRNVGQSFTQMQFTPTDLRKEVDAVWFIKECGTQQVE